MIYSNTVKLHSSSHAEVCLCVRRKMEAILSVQPGPCWRLPQEVESEQTLSGKVVISLREESDSSRKED